MIEMMFSGSPYKENEAWKHDPFFSDCIRKCSISVAKWVMACM